MFGQRGWGDGRRRPHRITWPARAAASAQDRRPAAGRGPVAAAGRLGEVAAEQPAGYDPGPASVLAGGAADGHASGSAAGSGAPVSAGLGSVVAGLAGVVEALAGVDVDAEPDGELLEAVRGLYRLADRLAGQQLRLVEAVDRRQAYRAEGAVSTGSWLRNRIRADHGTASRQAQAARRLRSLPRLRAALESGAVSLAHVLAVTDAAAPRRVSAIAEAEPVLVALACAAAPRQVRVAVRRVAELIDPDGSEAAPLVAAGPDERRHLDLRYGVDGLWELHATLDTVHGELLATALNAVETPDPAGTPAPRRRSPGQRRADALAALARRILDRGDTPVVGGVRPHLLLMADLRTLSGQDRLATRAPRLRFAGAISPPLARRIAVEADPTLRAVLTLGPWRAVDVGRVHRSLPGWLRPALDALHSHCRGPDCDRRVVWSDAHHVHPWAQGGRTDLNATVPLCEAHHALVTDGGWRLAYDPDRGVCTWTSPAGRTITTVPPPLHPDPLPQPAPDTPVPDWLAPHLHPTHPQIPGMPGVAAAAGVAVGAGGGEPDVTAMPGVAAATGAAVGADGGEPDVTAMPAAAGEGVPIRKAPRHRPPAHQATRRHEPASRAASPAAAGRDPQPP